jgi:hypothetical protein
MLVQLLRERVRAKSLRCWSKQRDVAAFSRAMQASRTQLRAMTVARNQNSAGIEKAARDFLENPNAPLLLASDLEVLRPLLRWVRRKIVTGQIDREWLNRLQT